MTFSELLDWQWRDYGKRHRNRMNLIIHIVAVPLFWLGAVNVITAVLFEGALHAFSGAILIGLSLFAQGRGHEMEALPPIPFDTRWNFVRRIVAEQFVTFPRFLVSGGWYENLKSSE